MSKYFLIFLLQFMLLDLAAQTPSSVKYIKAEEVNEGDGATVKRIMPTKGLKDYDPYVLFDDFSITPPNGFPDHFHSGFEVVTYVKEGLLQHKDSRGNEVVLGAGDIQCFTTGSGIVHSEMPVGTAQVRGYQVWINLPKVDKQLAPGYVVTRAAAVPVTKINDFVSKKIIAGVGASVLLRAKVVIEEYDIKAGGIDTLRLPLNFHGLLYVVSGTLLIGNKKCSEGDAVLFSKEPLSVSTSEDVVVLLLSGLPLGETIRRRGSIVK